MAVDGIMQPPQFMKNKSSQSHLGRARRYPHVRECTLPLRVLAIACRMRNEALRSVMGRCGSVTGRYRTLRERYGALTQRYGTDTENIDFAQH